MKKIYVKGVFDIIHFGHIRFFKKARSLGDFLTVGISPDSRATLMKRPPIFSFDERAEVVKSIKYVDEIFTNGPLLISLEFMKENKFDIYAFGAFNSEERDVRLKECVDLPKSMICEIPYSLEISTSKIIKAINFT